MMRRFVFALALMAAQLVPDGSQAEGYSHEGLTWRAQKCLLYKRAWDAAYLAVDQQDVSEEFLSRNASFLAAGCRERVAVCPRSKAEFDMANMLTIMTMNEGMASTFVPFSCRADSD